MAESPDVWYVRPVFFVADCEASLRFYAALGFTESWRHEADGRPLVVQVARNDFELILNRREAPVGGGRMFFSLYAQPMAELRALIAAAGLELRQGYWGMPVKVILDPDGNELFFSTDD